MHRSDPGAGEPDPEIGVKPEPVLHKLTCMADSTVEPQTIVDLIRSIERLLENSARLKAEAMANDERVKDFEKRLAALRERQPADGVHP